MEVKLIVLVGSAKGREIPLPASQFIIGRAPNCHLRPHSEMVSKLHCAIGRKAGKVLVRDLKSSNKTYVNDEPVTGVAFVNHGDVLGVGPLKFRFSIETDADSLIAPAIRKDHLQWLMEDSQEFEMNAEGETAVIDIPPHLLDDDTETGEGQQDEARRESVARESSDKDLSAGKYLRDYFEPKDPPEDM